jgi:hypothetical protein
MGTCCEAHLTTKIRDYAKNAQNGAVTVTVIENPKVDIVDIGNSNMVFKGTCDYCKAPAQFTVSYYPKQTK